MPCCPLRSSLTFLTLLPALGLLLLTGHQAPSATQPQPGPAATLELRPGDHVSIIGNTLADRMQHDGWLETYFYSRFPGHDLVFRNLGFSADELKVRLRSANFGSPDKWLTQNKTDVVLAFFGYNESFAGQAGLPQFKKDLTTFIQNTLAQKYNGTSAPRLVLFSPIAHEDLHDPNLPDGSDNNKRLALYTAAMAEVAAANKVPFVDLYHPTLDLYPKSPQPFTINGIHLNAHGNEVVARLIDKALFAKLPEPARDPKQMEKLRQAVVNKNFYWFNRYRTVDGYSIYGGRAKLSFNGQTNKEVMDREMEVLDVMTANRDKRVWAVARGGDLAVDDKNVPPFLPVQTNKPGPLVGGKHIFADPQEAIMQMTVAKGMKVNLFASEKEFPELTNPVQMAWDTKGRLWVAVWPTYPHWKPGEPMNDKLLIFEDTKGTGKADKCTVFADGLHCPTGFAFYDGGVLIAQAPNLVFLKDTKGTGKADLRVRVLSGLDSADTHHTANSFTFDPGGALYFQEGTFHHTQVETPWGPAVRNKNAGVYRYEPRTKKFEVYVNSGFANPHGHVFTRWGEDVIVDGTGANPYQGALISGQTADMDQRHPRTLTLYKPRSRPCPGVEILSSRHFPDEMQGDLLVPNVITFQGIFRYKLSHKGAGLIGTEAEPILRSSDPNFRPSDIRVGPDGAIYFIDWHNPIIGHMQHNLRDPNRDREHGRIYRITYEGRPLLKPVMIDGEPIEKLLDLLKEPEDRVRYRVRTELGGRPTDKVIAAAQKWVAGLDAKDPEYQHHLMEALWLHQSHNVVNEELLRRLLRSPDARARAAATRVLCYWRDRVKDPLDLLRTQINDDEPLVRLEAIRALSFFKTDVALAVAVELLAHPTDPYLNFAFTETLNTLERRLSAGTKLNRANIAESLVKLLEKGNLGPGRTAAVVETICRHGTAKELKAIWQRTLSPKTFEPVLRSQALQWLAEAALTRKVQPTVNDDEIQNLLNVADDTLLPDVLHLLGAWKLQKMQPVFQQYAHDAKAPQDVRFAAMDGLAALRDADSLKALRALTDPKQPLAVQFHAAVALTDVDLKEGARAAAVALARPDQDVDPGNLIQAFLNRKDGSDQLAAALEKQKLAPDTAKRILRAMLLAGRSDPPLANLVSKFAGLDAVAKLPTAAEIQKLGEEVMAKGDAARGELVFLRGDLGCMKCHTVNKAGGHVGPDLGPVGGASPLDYIVQSVLDPNASIKEEYLTKVITTTRGQIVTGIVVERNKDVVVLKDATGKLVRIATADIDEEGNGKSLMPEGITRTLTHGELVDLLRFVSELGKSGPYAVRTPPTIQRWKVLRTVPKGLADAVPTPDALREQILKATGDAWEIAYARVNGSLPLAELHRAGQPRVLYVQAEINVSKVAAVTLTVEGPAATTFWVDDQPHDKLGKIVATLQPGRHFVTVRVPLGDDAAAALRVEVRRAAGSKGSFEVVQGD
jgi:putative heme-binding domain-containing protein